MYKSYHATYTYHTNMPQKHSHILWWVDLEMVTDVILIISLSYHYFTVSVIIMQCVHYINTVRWDVCVYMCVCAFTEMEDWYLAVRLYLINKLSHWPDKIADCRLKDCVIIDKTLSLITLSLASTSQHIIKEIQSQMNTHTHSDGAH